MVDLRTYGSIPINTVVLEEAMSNYRAPKDKIRTLVQQGKLIRLRNGLYVVSDSVTGRIYSLELIANSLYGPSYVSYESSLSFHGIIPERVYMVRSACISRGRTYQTPLGVFEYIRVPRMYYPIGIESVIIRNEYAFLMARPEKALCDLIQVTKGLRIQSLRAMHQYIEEDMRMDTEVICTWDASIVESCIAHGYKRNELRFLLNYIRNEQRI